MAPIYTSKGMILGGNARHKMGAPLRGAVAFAPSDVSGLLVWLKSDTGVTTSGGNMTQWNDQSGNGNHFLPGGTCPYTASDADFNGKPSIANYIYSNPTLAYAEFSIFIVAKVTGAGNWLYGHQTAYASHTYDAVCANNATNAFQVEADGGDAEKVSAPVKGATWAQDAGVSTFAFIYDGTTTGSQMRVDGVAETISGTNHTPVTNTHRWALLALDHPDGSPTAGKSAEIIIYDRKVTNTERDNIESYLRTRYAHY